MSQSATPLFIASPENYSGKSAVILGLAHQLQAKGLNITYAKPLGTDLAEAEATQEEDVTFVATTLNLPPDRILPALVSLGEKSILARISGADQTDYRAQLHQSYRNCPGDLVLIEGAGTLEEGRLFGLSAKQIMNDLEAAVVLVTRVHSSLVVEPLLAAKLELGDRLIGVVLNDVPLPQLDQVHRQVCPFLQQQGIEVLGVLPRNELLRSVSVAELVHRLQAEVLCRADRLDLMVESLKIGAMNVNSALEFFRKGQNMAVVTGGDRTDIQLAALETSTQCLILTGHLPPSPIILSRAEELEIPILSVDLDTLTTVEIIDDAFGQVRLHEPVKVQAICQMMTKYFNFDRFLEKLELSPRRAA